MKKLLLILTSLLLTLVGIVIWQLLLFSDQQLHIIFCDVGQGDAILMRTPQQKVILLDAGPEDHVLACLDRHLPFWQRNINLFILSHPHLDHFEGMHYILERYRVLSFVTESLTNRTPAYTTLLTKIKEKRITFQTLYSGDTLTLEKGIQIRILGPDKDYLLLTSPTGQVGETKEFASLISLLTYGKLRILFTGDSQAEGLKRALTTFPLKHVDFLQAPHHGSKTGLNGEVVSLLSPSYAIISVGKNNYGHPSPETLLLFSHFHIPFFRTDKSGDIEIVSDGKRINLRSYK